MKYVFMFYRFVKKRRKLSMMSHTRKVTREVELGDIYESKRLQQRTLTESKEAVVDY
jgi:hypothetical protein